MLSGASFSQKKNLRNSFLVFIIECERYKCNFAVILRLPNAIPGAVCHDLNTTDVVSEFPKPTGRNIMSRRRQRHIVF
jgi:hypothetical protein